MSSDNGSPDVLSGERMGDHNQVVRVHAYQEIFGDKKFSGQTEIGNIKFTFVDGFAMGIAILLKNKTGAPSIKGYCVAADDTEDMAVKLVPINIPSCIGVFLDDDVPDGENAWVVCYGVAYVYFWGGTTRGYFARTGVVSDSGEISGQATSGIIPPTDPFKVEKYRCEIGNVLESRTGAGLAKTILHMN